MADGIYLKKMAIISNQQIRESLKAPSKTNTINKALRHENHIRFHVENYIDKQDMSSEITRFLDWVETMLPQDKFFIFKNLFRLPSPIVQETKKIFNELERVFDSKNSSVSYQFTDPKYNTEWLAFKNTEMNQPNVWKKTGWDRMRTSINSLMVVDLERDPIGDVTKPYFYFLDINECIDYGFDGEKITWLIIKQDDNRIAVFDDAEYRVYELNKNGELPDEPEHFALHNLGYTPAAFFWTSEISQKDRDIKQSPISPQLSNMDWLLFFSISKRHLDLYASYPIYSGYAVDCDFEDDNTGNFCDNGHMKTIEEKYIVDGLGQVAQCPVCSKKRLAGVGAYIEVPVPEKDGPDLSKPISITTVDKGSLDYNVEEVARLKSDIFTSCVGVGGDMTLDKAFNIDQINANIQGRVNVLNNIKGNLERAMSFVDDTVCRLMFEDNYIGSSISLGTEFYMYTLKDLYGLYETAKKIGSPSHVLDSYSKQILDTQYKNNPVQLNRLKILGQLEPFQHYTLDELLKLKEKTTSDGTSILDDQSVIIKINFNTFIDRFERENTDVIEFGSGLEFKKKIEIIFNELKSYVTRKPEITS